MRAFLPPCSRIICILEEDFGVFGLLEDDFGVFGFLREDCQMQNVSDTICKTAIDVLRVAGCPGAPPRRPGAPHQQQLDKTMDPRLG